MKKVCFQLLLFLCLLAVMPPPILKSTAAETVETSVASGRFDVAGYKINGVPLASTNGVDALLSRYTGTNVDVMDIVSAATDLQKEYRRAGVAVGVAVVPEQRVNGIVTLNVFEAPQPQIVVGGRRYGGTNETGIVLGPMTAETNTVAVVTTNAPPKPVIRFSSAPAKPEDEVRARAALFKSIAETEAKEQDRRVHVVSTNASPRFTVERYQILGNTVLPPQAIGRVLTNIDGNFGTNVSFDGIRAVVTELQKAYRERGYVTVSVGLPQQKLTNATVKLQVTEGRLADVNVRGNEYFSSNNIMRTLPSLHAGRVMNGLVFQDELNRANANQDRQIYPVIGPGPEPGTSELTLNVKDRLPLHAKTEFNNESSPGTPDLRMNSSLVYDNLWQLDHSIGLQYSFSPEAYKSVNQHAEPLSNSRWNFYDKPLVANYSGFYRMPLGGPAPVEDEIAGNPGSFGYNEATRKFNLPPASGQADLTVFASRSTIDTGLATLKDQMLSQGTNGFSLREKDLQQDLTENNDLGFRLTTPLKPGADFNSSISGGLDFKTYKATSYKTNTFYVANQEGDFVASITNIVNSTNVSPVPVTVHSIQYLPLSLHYDATLRGYAGVASFGLGISGNPWYSGSAGNLQTIAGSSKASGRWVTLTPSLTWNFSLYTNWMTTVRADGQWASEPLISNEQFGAGGVNSVRGYREGEVFGDEGWHFSVEEQTPSHTVGMVCSGVPLTVRGSVYMDYAKTYLLDPQGRPGDTGLWGCGIGGVASIGSHWDARFLFSLPLLKTATTQPYQPFFNFALTAQF